ncbi:hypothetical protein [Bifidobacterium moukalabense]|uniref:Phosphoglycerate dehydrogenase n=1 Tax=Bifidobacterium moukalabense DSM 27321 TaxID=1435051 RepID=W4N9K9_9BIFI|nr:hypothetical protein [Bifidobacterium moukalabense]ETY71719.1 phosphoglycerate dehydrogenase [Bifidobacterium moukalabense DSM 27321]
MNNVLSIAWKLEWLQVHGYVREINGEQTLSTKALSLISKVPVVRLRLAVAKGMLEEGNTFHIPEDMLRDMRRGIKELQAKYNTTSMIEILYAEATK